MTIQSQPIESFTSRFLGSRGFCLDSKELKKEKNLLQPNLLRPFVVFISAFCRQFPLFGSLLLVHVDNRQNFTAALDL